MRWAKWNIGATAVGGYGDYFAWGATYPQAKYESSDYRESSISANLPTDKDVAYQKLGENWHMPTLKDITSIISTSGDNTPAENVTWTWISGTSKYGTTGYEVYLTKDAEDDSKKIFLPAAGLWYLGLNAPGEIGLWWSTEFISSSLAYSLYFYGETLYWSFYARCYGQSVRPVKTKTVVPASGTTGEPLADWD